MALHIGLIVFPGFEVLDLAALTVFEMANVVKGKCEYVTALVSASGGLVAGSPGVRVETVTVGRRSFDTLLVAGSAVPPVAEDALLDRLRWHAPRVRRLGSICTGAFVLAQAGLLDGIRATTHWEVAHQLQQRHPSTRVDADRIFVRDGKIWSSAGMTACIDLALALVEQDLGPELVKTVSRKLVVHQRRVGGQSQFSMLSAIEPGLERIRAALDFARAHLTEPLTVEQLAAHVHWSARHFSRAFHAQTGISPAKAVEKLRMEVAQSMLDEGRHAVALVARKVGFGDEERMRRAFLRHLGQPPQAFARQRGSGRNLEPAS